MNNDIRIRILLEYIDGEGNENTLKKESMGSILNIRSAFESAGEDLGKLENQLNRLIAKGDTKI